MHLLQLEPTKLPAHRTMSFGSRRGTAETHSSFESEGISWHVRVDDRVWLKTGGTLAERSCVLQIAVGDATPEGKHIYRDGEQAQWGSLYCPKDHDSCFVILHISRSAFDRILHLVEVGRPPSVSLDVDCEAVVRAEDAVALEPISYRGTEDKQGKHWDNDHYPSLVIYGCTIFTEFGPPSADEISGGKPALTSLMPPQKYDVVAIKDVIVSLVNEVRRASELLRWMILVFVIVAIAGLLRR